MTEPHVWKVVPLSAGQLLDVRPEDILENGLYRRCSTYRGGGGYDRFPAVAARRLGGHADDYAEQFVVQLFGCNLDCPYCYVTRAGVWGAPVKVSTGELVSAFIRSGAPVFHLMGGAPALQLPWWGELIGELYRRANGMVFHSDLMLSEARYIAGEMEGISRPACLYAVNVKGLTAAEWEKNTRKPFNAGLFWFNLRLLQSYGVPAYITFTGVDSSRLNGFWNEAEHRGVDSAYWVQDSYVIDLIDYDAVPHVDDVPWGVGNKRAAR